MRFVARAGHGRPPEWVETRGVSEDGPVRAERGSVTRRTATTLAAVLTAVTLGACSSSGGTGTSDGNFVSGDGTITVVAADRREQPITLSGTTLTGSRLDVASLRGNVVVLNVWGSWCPPCRKEAPDLVAAAKELAPRGVEFLGINTRDADPAPALAYEKTFGIGYPSLVDDGGRLLLSLRGAVPPNAIPTTLVLDREGRIAARISGGTTKATLTSVVEDVLAGGAGAGVSAAPSGSGTP